MYLYRHRYYTRPAKDVQYFQYQTAAKLVERNDAPIVRQCHAYSGKRLPYLSLCKMRIGRLVCGSLILNTLPCSNAEGDILLPATDLLVMPFEYNGRSNLYDGILLSSSACALKNWLVNCYCIGGIFGYYLFGFYCKKIKCTSIQFSFYLCRTNFISFLMYKQLTAFIFLANIGQVQVFRRA
jgi:hypothetical protein